MEKELRKKFKVDFFFHIFLIDLQSVKMETWQVS